MDEGGLLDYRKNPSFTVCQSFIHTRDRRPSKPLVYKLQETRMKERFPLAVMDFAALVPDALLPPTSRCQWQQWPPSRPKTLLYYTHVDVKNATLLLLFLLTPSFLSIAILSHAFPALLDVSINQLVVYIRDIYYSPNHCVRSCSFTPKGIFLFNSLKIAKLRKRVLAQIQAASSN